MTWQYRNRWIRGTYDIAGKKVLVEDPGYHPAMKNGQKILQGISKLLYMKWKLGLYQLKAPYPSPSSTSALDPNLYIPFLALEIIL